MEKQMINEISGLDVAKMCGCEDIYLRNKEQQEADTEKRQSFQESFKRIFEKIDRKPTPKDKRLV